MINARIRKRVAGRRASRSGCIGPRGLDLTYGHDWLGEGRRVLRALPAARTASTRCCSAAKRPMLILGRGALARPDGAAVLAAAWQVAAQNDMLQAGLARLQPAAPVRRPGRRAGPRLPAGTGGKALGAMLAAGCDVLWLLGADEFEPARIPAEHLRDLPGPSRRGRRRRGPT